MPLSALAQALLEAWKEAEETFDKRYSDRQMSAKLGVGLRTFRAALKIDPDAYACAVQLPRPGRAPLRMWRGWQLEARWQGGPPRRRRRTKET